MARISADGQDYTATWSLGTQANLTVCAWVKIVTDRNDYSTIFSVDNGTGDNWLMQTDADGTTLSFVGDATTQQGIGSMTVGAWYFIALATAGASGTIYYRTAATQTMSTVAVTGVTASVNAVNFRIGDSPWTAEWWNGCINSVKAWTAQLSAAEVANEAQQYVPLRTANLVAFHPLVQPETADYSGNSRTLSGGAGATREDGPPIPWRMVSPQLFLPVAGGGSDLNLSDVAGGIRAGSVDQVSAVGVAVPDLSAGATRSTVLAETTATGRAVVDPSAGGVRSGNVTGESAVNALVVTDSSAGAVRIGSATSTVVIGVIRADTAGAVRTGTSRDTPAAGLILADAAGAVRGGKTFGETATSALVVLDPGTGQIRLGTVGGETAADVGELVDFVCQDFTGTATPVAHAGTSTVVSDGGTQTLVSYGGTHTAVSYGGTASICGR